MSKGFTLIELIVVMAILATLIGIGLSSYTNSISKAHDAKRKADLKQIQLALEKYKEINGNYPRGGWYASTDAGTPWIPGLTADYIKDLPDDPKNVLGSPGGDPSSAGNYIYGYYSVTSPNVCSSAVKEGDYYILATRLENLSDQDAGSTMLTSTCNWPNPAVPNVYAVSNP